MTRYLLVLVALMASAGPAPGRTVPDSAGRTLEVPPKVTRVSAAGPPASVLLYILAPEKLAGWPRAPTDHLAAPYRGPADREADRPRGYDQASKGSCRPART